MKFIDKLKEINNKSSKPMKKKDVIFVILFVACSIFLIGYEKIVIEPTLHQDIPMPQINDSHNTIDLSDMRYCDYNGNCDTKLDDKIQSTKGVS